MIVSESATSSAICEDKSILRKKVLAVRNALTKDEISEKSDRIFNKLSQSAQYRRAQSVLIYASMGSEVMTDSVIQDCLFAGKRVFCPKVTDLKNRKMNFVQIHTPEDLKAGFHGIREPEISDDSIIFSENTVKDIPEEIPLVIMPGVVFDRHRNRIGYNGGFYDTFLEANPKLNTIAIAFSLQISDDEIPHDKHDIKPAMIITEDFIISA